MEFDLDKHTIHLTIHGSHAYSLATGVSDLDTRGVCIPPKPYFYGFLRVFEQAISKVPGRTIFDIRKFFALAAECNLGNRDSLYQRAAHP
jgi:predicted nucleotidyltransferase